MSVREHVGGIKRAREGAASTLLAALKSLGEGYSERCLADTWLGLIGRAPEVLPFGWYQPPPNGLSVLIGCPPRYERLAFESLRFEEYWPKAVHRYSENAILYPYFSAIDRATLMIGDHVGTYYAGTDDRLRDWIRACYKSTRLLAESVEPGMRFSELFALAMRQLSSVGASNNNFSLSGGLASDIGHTIPFFASADEHPATSPLRSPELLTKVIADARNFVSAENHNSISAPCALTIEPQMTAIGYPMVGFHVIVIVTNEGVQTIDAYGELFDFFGMKGWIEG